MAPNGRSGTGGVPFGAHLVSCLMVIRRDAMHDWRMATGSSLKVTTAVRLLFGTATFATLAVALLVRTDARWYVISGVLGLIWWGWDLLLEYLFVPIGDWFLSIVVGGALDAPTAGTRPTLDDTVRLLEHHLARPTSRKVDINAAVRLEEIYRVVKKDSVQAQRVIDVVLERYPKARELERFRKARAGTVEDGGEGV